MRYLLSSFALVLCFCLALTPINSVAQDQDEEHVFYSYGEVLSVMQGQIMVREFDYATGEEKDVVYYITTDTILEPVELADKIKPGDLVDVEFMISEDGKNTAEEILVDRIEDYEEVDEEVVVIE
ncbi:MAG: hypothetical protein D4S01_09795 [Dehalococcoidia bacterium]|nr:MAG: hypothetical protein D4S01_09795 [Dehalococcoidia bacterium]